MVGKNTAKLNMTFYKGSDFYSDGDVENDIFSITQKIDDFSEVLKNDDRWALLYHLTPLRRNLLEWYNFDKNATLLEIGAGCGALTGLFCEKLSHVTAVELSKRRAEIILNRTQNHENLEIIVGNLNDIKFEKKFDYITLVGALEYAGRFTKTENPYADFIGTVKQLLAPNGTLIIAIENKFGLKYWNGAKEDHTGKLFDSIEGYKDDVGIQTFGKAEIEDMLREQGFTHLDFYYPMPDYKIPTQIFSDLFTPQYGQMTNFSTFYDQKREELFDEKAAYANIIKNRLFGVFANSFLIFAGNSDVLVKNVYSNFRRTIDENYMTLTSIVSSEDEMFSIKKPLNVKSELHIKKMFNNYAFLSDKIAHISDINVAKCEYIDGIAKFEYIDGIGLHKPIQDCILNSNKKLLLENFLKYKELIYRIYSPKVADFNSSSLKELFGDVSLQGVYCSDYANFDLIFDNIILKNDSYYIIDYEWVVFELFPVNFIISRNVYNLYYKYGARLESIISQEDLLSFLDISKAEQDVYCVMEENFLNYIHSCRKNDLVKNDKPVKRSVLIKNISTKVKKIIKIITKNVSR